MALTAPPAFVAANIPATWLDRGGSYISKPTTSSKSKPTAYTEDDICGNEAYVRGGHSISISVLRDCAPINVATLSLKARFAAGTVKADMDALSLYLSNELFSLMDA